MNRTVHKSGIYIYICTVLLKILAPTKKIWGQEVASVRKFSVIRLKWLKMVPKARLTTYRLHIKILTPVLACNVIEPDTTKWSQNRDWRSGRPSNNITTFALLVRTVVRTVVLYPRTVPYCSIQKGVQKGTNLLGGLDTTDRYIILPRSIYYPWF